MLSVSYTGLRAFLEIQGQVGPAIPQEDYKVSLILGVSAMTLASAVGMSSGLWRPCGKMVGSIMALWAWPLWGSVIPTFVTAPMLVLVFGSILQWLPNGGWNGGAIENLILPVFVLSLPQIAIISRFTRAGMVEVLTSNYVRPPGPRGFRPIASSYIMPCGRRSCPLSIIWARPAPALLRDPWSWKIFALPGLGKFFIISAMQRDYTVVMGMVIFDAALVLFTEPLADLAVATLDPRVSLI